MLFRSYAKNKYQTNKHKFFLIKNNILPFKSNTFDIVTSNAVIEHIQDPVKAVNELFRVARRGCVITFPYGHEADSPDHIQHFYEKDVEELFSNYNCKSSIVYDRPDGNRCFLVIIKK